METDENLGPFTIPTPCPMDWDQMPGDERRRYCAACGKHVYNLNAMRPDERASLTSKALSGEDEVCGRLDHRFEGKLFASEFQPAAQGGVGARQYTIRWLMMVIAACATVLGVAKAWLVSPDRPEPTPPPRTLRFQLMGKMVPVRRSVTTPATSAPSCTTPGSPAPRADG